MKIVSKLNFSLSKKKKKKKKSYKNKLVLELELVLSNSKNQIQNLRSSLFFLRMEVEKLVTGIDTSLSLTTHKVTKVVDRIV